MVKYSEKSKYFPTPPSYLKIYIYTGAKKDGYIWAKLKKLRAPPIAPNIAGDFPTYGLLFDMGADPYGT
jgi:hypothetical protein